MHLCHFSKYVVQEDFSEKIEVPFGHSLYKVEEPEHQSLVLVEGRNVKETWVVLYDRTYSFLKCIQCTSLQMYIIPTDRPYERPLQQLLYYSMNGRVNEFHQEVSVRGQNARDKTWFPSPLKGPGTLYLPRNSEVSRACYQDYSVSVLASLELPKLNTIKSKFF